MDDPILLYEGNTGPAILDQIKDANNTPIPLVGLGYSLAFKARPTDGETLAINRGALILTNPTGAVRYDPQPGDTDTPGDYQFWWTYTSASLTSIDTKEFPLTIAAHAPGGDFRTGAVAEYLSDVLPATYRALIDPGQGGIGPEGIQRQVDLAKAALFASIVDVRAEVSVYPAPVLDYTARVAALRIIPFAIDYWGDQRISRTSTGTAETESFPERREELWKIYDRLRAWVRLRKLTFDGSAWTLSLKSGGASVPVVSNTDDPDYLLYRDKNRTPNPATFPRLAPRFPYGVDGPGSLYPWGSWHS